MRTKVIKRLSLGLVLAIAVSIPVSANATALGRYEVNAAETSNTRQLEVKQSNSNFVGVDHPTQGRVSIVEEDGLQYLEISSDFITDKGPDLEVILHSSATVDARVQPGKYLNLGALKAFNDRQRYQLPQDLDLNEYQSVAIWCEHYNVTFSYAPLN